MSKSTAANFLLDATSKIKAGTTCKNLDAVSTPFFDSILLNKPVINEEASKGFSFDAFNIL